MYLWGNSYLHGTVVGVGGTRKIGHDLCPTKVYSQVGEAHTQTCISKAGGNVLQKQKGEGERREKTSKRYPHCDVSSPGGEEREGHFRQLCC